MILVHGSVVIQKQNLAQALAVSQEHVLRSRAEPGCLAHAVHRDTEDPNRLVFVERWADRAALARHFAVPASGAFVRALAALAIGAPEMAIYEGKELRADQLATG